ncbi:MAG: type II toxin-antitoxin system death-on-curing family toxin [Candidatus Riflebacteria bacterium]|nr:type II toxin-antitoxin system death-on-curing family toxin [Candidatus Riflebacteria bacterium]
MMRYLSVAEVLALHRQVIAQTGGAPGLRDLPALESALAQPRQTFGGEDLHATVLDKAAAVGFTLIANHPFVDGNKRVGHAAMETFLLLNGYELNATVDDQEAIILAVADGQLDRTALHAWLVQHVVPHRP